MVEKVMTYALGRGLTHHDAPTVRRIVREMDRDGYRWSSLLLAVVRSEQFQMRQTSSPARPAASASQVAGRQ
jgi:hypothetical protein